MRKPHDGKREGSREPGAWRPVAGEASFDEGQLALMDEIERDLRERLAERPRRLAHSLSVADTACHLALLYGVDPFDARVAGLLHDWDKALEPEELLRRAREEGLDLGVDLELVEPLLHGILAARELPERYPMLAAPVFQAIARHTTAAEDMSPLDEVVFVADGIEPLRRESAGIARTRSLVGRASLDDVFWESFTGGIVYVIEGARYLYPGTIDVYNAIAARRARGAATGNALK